VRCSILLNEKRLAQCSTQVNGTNYRHARTVSLIAGTPNQGILQQFRAMTENESPLLSASSTTCRFFSLLNQRRYLAGVPDFPSPEVS
jgi:hypothetical protein